jgi:hypothetical protein
VRFPPTPTVKLTLFKICRSADPGLTNQLRDRAGMRCVCARVCVCVKEKQSWYSKGTAVRNLQFLQLMTKPCTPDN